MKKSIFTESRIIKEMMENESDRQVEELCRELGFSTATFYAFHYI